MTVKYSQYAAATYLTIGTALSASGTVVPPVSNGQRILLNSLQFFSQVPGGTVTVTLALGSGTVPAIGLTLDRSTFTVPPYVLDQNTGITATLSGAGTVGFWGNYLVATND